MGTTETPDGRRWRSMSDLHVDITEALEQGFSHRMIAVEFGVDIELVEGVAEDLAPTKEEPVGLLLLDARWEVQS